MKNPFKSNKKRYYREWLSCHGAGIMLSFDTVITYTASEAANQSVIGMYANDKSFECVTRVKEEHLHLNDHQLSQIYGKQE